MSSEWSDVRLGDVVKAHKVTVDPKKLGAELVDHYSLPAFDRGGGPERVRANTIKSNKLNVPAGAVLVSRLNPHIPRVWAPSVDSELPSICSTEFAVLTATGCEPRFLQYFVASDQLYGRMSELVGGTSTSHQRVSLDDLLDCRALLPTLAEQTRIADVLDAVEHRERLSLRVCGLLAESADLALLRAPTKCLIGDFAAAERVHWRPERNAGQLVDHYSLPAFDAGRGPERVEATEIGSNKLAVEANRVLFSRLNPDRNRTWMCTPSTNVDASVCSTEYAVLNPEGVPLGVLWAALCSGKVGTRLAVGTTGTSASHQRVNEKAVLAAEVPDPRSLDEGSLEVISQMASSFVCRQRELSSLRTLRSTLASGLVDGRLGFLDAVAGGNQ